MAGNKNAVPKVDTSALLGMSAVPQQTITRAITRTSRSIEPDVIKSPQEEARDYAQQFVEEAIDGIVAIARDTGNKDHVRLSAWASILDRAIGKVPQPAEIVTTETISHSSMVEEMRNAAMIDARRLDDD